MTNKKILLFQIPPSKKKKIEELCRSLRPEIDITLVSVRREQYAENLGYLAGIEGIPSTRKLEPDIPFPGEMMVFSGITSEELDVFLDAWKEKRLEKVALKAVLTPGNILWTPQKLLEELKKEHAALTGV